jgi:hypothetical protein
VAALVVVFALFFSELLVLDGFSRLGLNVLLLVQSHSQSESLDVKLIGISDHIPTYKIVYAVPLIPQSDPHEFSMIQAFLLSMMSQPMIFTA